ncbi:MAG TPA: ABC transporter permease [Bryobacteraceae bacterium]|nr:ABC transporter permease [Bryobacteraceae bacterium]
MESFAQDLRFAFRTLAKSPGFLTVAVLSLGLGIGANTAIFSLINAAMLRALPVSHPERLVLLTDPGSSGVAVETREWEERYLLAYPEFEQLRAHNTVFSGMFAAESELSDLDVFTGLSGEEQSTKAHVQLVSGEFFSVLGLHPILGRGFTTEEDRVPGANPVGVISHGFWQREFGGDSAVVGRNIRVGQSQFKILGVTPPGFRGMVVGADTDVWIPITMQEQVLRGRNYLKPIDTLWLQVMARLAPGVSLKQAQAGINVSFQQILRGWAADLPTEEDRRKTMGQRIVLHNGAKGASELRDQFSDPLLLLMAMVGLVLLIACANIANLMLARASGRQREIGVRVALGASRARLIRQLLTESIVVAALGGILGAFLAVWGTDVLLALVSGGVNNLSLEVQGDSRVFLFTAAISLATGILFGLAPAVRATRLDVNQTLAANARGSIGGRGRTQTGRMLVVTQVALSVVLLMGATLFVRTLHNLVAQKLGFNREQILMATIDPISAGYRGATVPALYQQVRENLRTIPGVRDVTASQSGLFGGDSGDRISLDAATSVKKDELRSRWTLVGPDYFKTLGIPLLRGREIDAADAARGAQVCVVNQTFAEFFFPNGDPIGKHVTDEYPTTRETYEIVGVVADVKEHSVREPKRQRFYANLFHPIGTVESVTFLLSGTKDPSQLSPAVRNAIAGINRSLPVLSIRTLNEQIDRRLITPRLIAELAAFFGGLALLMAAIGLYGVMSYSMSRRTSEIGIRMALGASQRSVAAMVLRETLMLVAIGLAIGLPSAIVAARLMQSRLFGLSAADPATIALAIVFILTATLLAGFVPARRAARIDPMSALRTD